MAGAVRLPAAAVEAAVRVAREHGAAWRESCYCTGAEWPEGMCVDSSWPLFEDLHEKVPIVRAMYVFGWFGLPEDLCVRSARLPARGIRCGHAWVELADTTIIDLTAGQFGPFWRLFVPDVKLEREMLVVAPDGAERIMYERREVELEPRRRAVGCG